MWKHVGSFTNIRGGHVYPALIRKTERKPLVGVALAGPDLSCLYVACGDKIYRRKTRTRGVLYFK